MYTKYFADYPLLDAKNIPGLNIFAVHQEHPEDEGKFCHYGCQGIQRCHPHPRVYNKNGYTHV